MTGESTGRKIWNVIYPVLALFVIYFAVVYGGMLVLSGSSCAAGSLDASMNRYFSIIVAIALVIVILVEWFFFKNDHAVSSKTYIKKPAYLALLLLFGAAASHGLNLLFSLLNVAALAPSYEAVQEEIFAPGVVMVIVRALILAPIAEELVFRGLTFRRMKGYTGFWPAALVSAALFGLYHMNLAQGIYAFLFGILLALIYERFQNLLAPMLVHFAANLLSVILEYTNASYPSVAVSVIVMIAAMAVAAAIWFFSFRKIKA